MMRQKVSKKPNQKININPLHDNEIRKDSVESSIQNSMDNDTKIHSSNLRKVKEMKDGFYDDMVNPKDISLDKKTQN